MDPLGDQVDSIRVLFPEFCGTRIFLLDTLVISRGRLFESFFLELCLEYRIVHAHDLAFDLVSHS